MALPADPETTATEALGALLDAQPAEVLVLDADGVVVAHPATLRDGVATPLRSALAAARPGLDLPELLEPVLRDRLGDATAARAALDAVLAGRAPRFDLELEQAGAGGTRWYALAATPRAGQPGAVLVVRDVTARHAADLEVRGRDAELRAVLDAVPEAVLLLGDDTTILRVNAAAALLLGRRPAELRGHRLGEFAAPSAAGWLTAVWEPLRAGAAPTAGWGFHHDDGSVREAEFAGHAPVGGGRHVVVLRDASETRRLEARLRTAQRMEAVGRLTGGIAHDFNNLLTVILANVTMLDGMMPSDEPEMVAEIASIRTAAQRGADMVRKLLAYARQEKLDLEPLTLGAAVAEHARLLRRLLPESITVTVELEEPQAVVRADTGALAQVLLNLATNARDAMPEGGSLVLRVRATSLAREECEAQGWGVPGEYVELDVEDTGTGMSDATRLRAFEPFFTTKPAGTGTGLGLSMVYGLVKQHDGFIAIRSAPGAGTQVRLLFPRVHAEPAARPEAAAAPAAVGGTETILLAEDEELIRVAAKRILERHGYRVLLASDGREALETWRRHAEEIALVVTDVVMPGMGGRELIERLRAGGRDVAVLCTSGYTNRDLSEGARLDDGVPFMHKPWTAGDLLKRVRAVLDAGRAGGTA